MKYLYKKTKAVVESGIRLNPAIFEPATEEKNVLMEEAPTEDIHVEEVVNKSDSAAGSNASSAKTSAKTTGTQKKTTTRKTTSTKK